MTAFRTASHLLTSTVMDLTSSKEKGETKMAWSKPTFVELRFGFEVTMYIWNR
jgi:coenzyme PQQ precursor peptide PqqA